MEMVTYLIENGADVNGKSKAGKTPLSMAVEPRQDPDVREPFYEIAEFLLSRDSSYTIFEAASLDDFERVKQLLEENAELVNFEANREPVLFAAIRQGHTETVDLLLNYGAEINVKGRYGEPPLHSAANKDFRDIVKLLLKRGADVNQKGAHGELALHWAAAKGHKDMAKLLVDAGSDVNIKADSVRVGMNTMVVETFDVVEEGLRYSESRQKQEQAKLAGSSLQIMGLIRVAFGSGDTPLHSASQWGHEEIVKLLIENGANVNATNKHGQSPLHYSCLFSHKGIQELLISRGANIDAQDNKGRTPKELSYAAEWISR